MPAEHQKTVRNVKIATFEKVQNHFNCGPQFGYRGLICINIQDKGSIWSTKQQKWLKYVFGVKKIKSAHGKFDPPHPVHDVL